jgi:hypothetical protein
MRKHLGSLVLFIAFAIAGSICLNKEPSIECSPEILDCNTNQEFCDNLKCSSCFNFQSEKCESPEKDIQLTILGFTLWGIAVGYWISGVIGSEKMAETLWVLIWMFVYYSGLAWGMISVYQGFQDWLTSPNCNSYSLDCEGNSRNSSSIAEFCMFQNCSLCVSILSGDCRPKSNFMIVPFVLLFLFVIIFFILLVCIPCIICLLAIKQKMKIRFREHTVLPTEESALLPDSIEMKNVVI